MVGQGGTPRAQREPSPIPWLQIAALAVMLVAALVITTIIILGPDDLNEDKKLRLDALKVVLAGFAGYGAAVTVWLSLRRQQYLEQESWAQRQSELEKQAADDRDSKARRALELYSAATNQLASDQAAVRLAGLYSFERLASEDSAYRQTVVDVFCAYLRMQRGFAGDADRLAEQEVRRAVQSLLVRHMRRPGEEDAWSDIHVNLAGAELFDFDGTGAYFEDATFTTAKFDGQTVFHQATFVHKGRFERCHFGGKTSFRRARFEAGVSFDSSEFVGQEAAFTGAHFAGSSSTSFRQCTFAAHQVIFRGARFSSVMSTNFSKARFSPGTSFKRTTFTSRVTTFNRAEFDDGAEPFMKAKFTERLLVEDVNRWTRLLRGAHVLGPVDRPPTSATDDEEMDDEAAV